MSFNPYPGPMHTPSGSSWSTVDHPGSMGATTAASPSPGPSRKRRAGSERVRVSRACDRCKGKKIRCTGKKPCSLCSRQGLECNFNASYRRGRLPPVEVEETQNASMHHGSGDSEQSRFGQRNSNTSSVKYIQQEGGQLDERFQDSPTNNHSQDIPLSPQEPTNIISQTIEATSRMPSSRNSPEPSQIDLQGHYVGPSSGVSFLLRAQKRLHKVVSLSPRSSIFTFGDAPLPEFDSSFFVLPPKEKAKALVARYFDYAVPTHRFLYRPAVEAWVEELYTNLGVTRERQGDRGKRAVTFMVFAQATEYMPKDSEHPDLSARYFQAAEHQLKAETGEIRLTSVQARLCQCFFLLSESRINHCWSSFGTTAHLMLALGIHRKRRRDAPYDIIEDECRKRVFWSAYTLDCYLSAALGRPRTFHNDDIDQELPSLLDDNQLARPRNGASTQKSQNIMLAPIYHAKLAQIVSGILKDIYSIKPVRSEALESYTVKYSNELYKWRNGISRFLDVEVSLLNMLFQRQSNVLKLAYAHAQILTHRPVLLRNFADLTRRNYGASTTDKQKWTENGVAICLEGAMSIAGIVNDLCESNQNFRGLWFTHYYAFCAAVILYIYTIQCRGDAPETWGHYFAAAEKCQRQICIFKDEKDSFAQRYSIVLEELRLEAVKQTGSPQNGVSSTKTAPPNQSPSRNHELDQDTEVARTILRLSDNNPPIESYGVLHNNPQPEQFQRMDNTMNTTLPLDQSQASLNQGAFEGAANMQQPAIMHNTNQFTYNHTASPGSSMMEDGTGWGEFDSFVMVGIGGLESQYYNSMETLNTDSGRWGFTDINTAMGPGDGI